MIFTAIVLAIIALLAGVIVGWFVAANSARRMADDAARQVSQAAIEQLRAEQSDQLRATLDTVVSVASSKLGDQLEAGRFVLNREREQVSAQVDGVESELRRVADLVATLQKERAEQNGQLTTGLSQALAATTSLANTTNSLREALASSRARGQWGERMADDVLRAAGFLEGTNYVRQKKLSGGGVPDYTFVLPAGRVVHMDVKFPIDNYMRWLDADDAAKPRYVKAFKIDVRNRIKELTGRGYVDAESTVDYLLAFVPNESVYGFLHENDPELIDVALSQKVVLCSPTTLFAVLAVIRQATENFMIEQRSYEIMAAVTGLREQWEKWCEPIEKMRRGLDSAQKAFDDLAGTRSRQFERQLERLECLRDQADDQKPNLRQVI